MRGGGSLCAERPLRAARAASFPLRRPTPSQMGVKDVTLALDAAALRSVVAQFQGVREQLAAIAGDPAAPS